MPDTSVEVFRVDLGGNFKSEAAAAAAAGDKLADSLAGISGAASKPIPPPALIVAKPAIVDAGKRLIVLHKDVERSARAAARASERMVAALGRTSDGTIVPPALVNVGQRLSMLHKDEAAAAAKAGAAAKAAADKQAAAAAKAAAAQEKYLAKLRATAHAAAGGGLGIIDGWAKMGRLMGHNGQSAPGSVSAGASVISKIAGGIEKALGPKASAGFMRGLTGAVSALDKLEPYGPLLKAGGAAIKFGAVGLAAAGAVVLAAGAAIAVGAAKLASAIIKLGVEQTSKKEIQSAIFGQIGGSYSTTVKLAAKYGIDEDEAIRQVKGLLGAKFSKTDIPVIIRAAVGLGAVKGQEKAKTFLENLEKQRLKGKANEETVKSFAESGIDVEQVYARIAKKIGTSVDIAKGKVKSGAVDMATVLGAVQATADKQFGGIAGKIASSVPAMLGNVQAAFHHLFDSFDLGPLKGALGNLLGILGGPEGEKLKSSMGKLGSTLIKTLFGPFEGAKGQERLRRLVEGMTNLAEVSAQTIARLAPYVEKLADAFVTLFGSGKEGDTLSDKLLGLFATIGSLDPISLITELGNAIVDGLFGIDILGAAADIGSELPAGLADGIMSGASAAISAAEQMASDALAAAKAILGVASPSKEFAFLGKMSSQGFAAGAENDNAAADAGAGLGRRALGAAADAAGGAGAAGKGAAGGGGQVIHFAPVIHLPAGSSAQTKAAAQEGVEAAYQQFLSFQRRAARGE